MSHPDRCSWRTLILGLRWRRFRPWVLGGLAWAVASYLIIREYLGQTEGEYLKELCILLSLAWWQFVFAGLFQALRHSQGWKLPGLTVAAVLPPVGVCLTVMLGK